MSAQDTTHSPPTNGLQTWHLSLSYDGTAYHGWQVQPGVSTVQDELTQALRRLYKSETLKVQGTSRTDAGVHALDQQASFKAPYLHGVDAAVLQKVLNRWLPQDIRITAGYERPDNFNARFSAKGKAYIYGLHCGQTCSPFEARYLWHCPRKLNLTAMKKAAEILTGAHDFASFAVHSSRETGSTVRTLHRVEVIEDGQRLFVCVLGDSFLYKMVRSLVGYLVQVGKSKTWYPQQTKAVLAARDRGAAANTAPPEGLFLAKVFFSPDEWQSYVPSLPPYTIL